MENSLIRGLSPGGSVESSSTSERVICGGLVEQSVMEGRTMEDAIFAWRRIQYPGRDGAQEERGRRGRSYQS